MSGISYFDGHCDTASLCSREGWELRRNPGHVDLERGRVFGRWAQTFAFFGSRSHTPPSELPALLRRQHDWLLRETAANADRAALCRTEAEVRAANDAGRCAVLQSIENAELLSCDPAMLETAAGWGVRSINLTWNDANALSGSNCQEPERGLSDRGRAFVREMYRLGILPDVSHLSDAGFRDVTELGLGPVIASHSNLRSVCPHPRNLTDDQFRAVAGSGGVAGLNLFTSFVGGRGTLDDLRRHIDRALELGGQKHLAVGADLDGCDSVAAGVRGLQDIPSLWDRLVESGYEKPLLLDIFYSNMLHMLPT